MIIHTYIKLSIGYLAKDVARQVIAMITGKETRLSAYGTPCRRSRINE